MIVLVICTGNTCRSPLAEGLLRQRAREGGLLDLEVISAGTAAVAGFSATLNAVAVAFEKGIDISSHRSKLLTPGLVSRADLILAMERTHVKYSGQLGGNGKTHLISQFAHGEGGEVRDPIGGSLPEYREVLERLDGEVRRIITHLRDAEERSRRSGERTREE
jgi:protein-tyrosine phosphatase